MPLRAKPRAIAAPWLVLRLSRCSLAWLPDSASCTHSPAVVVRCFGLSIRPLFVAPLRRRSPILPLCSACLRFLPPSLDTSLCLSPKSPFTALSLNSSTSHPTLREAMVRRAADCICGRLEHRHDNGQGASPHMLAICGQLRRCRWDCSIHLHWSLACPHFLVLVFVGAVR